MRYSPLILIALLAIVGGCEHDHIRITITPGPDGSFVRTIRLWKTDSEKPGAILAPRSALYDLSDSLVAHVRKPLS